MQGATPGSSTLVPEGSPRSGYANVLYLCEQAGLELEGTDRDSINAWILGGLIDEATTMAAP